MNLLLYVSAIDRRAERLWQVTVTSCPERGFEFYRTIESLTQRLRQPIRNLEAAVFYTARRDDLEEILMIRNLLEGLRILLILPDRKKETVARSHFLKPCYLAYPDSDLTEVKAVLKKIFNRPASGTRRIPGEEEIQQ